MSQKKESKIVNQRERIIKVSSRLMSQKGYKGASLQEIANLVGIHKSTLFHYFKNKEELLLVVLKISIEEVTENLELILENEKLSPEEKLRQAIINHLDLLVRYKDNVIVYHSEIRFLSAKNRRKYIESRKYYASVFKQIIDEIKESDSGCFSGLDTKIVTFGILGMCNWMVKWFKGSGPFNARDIADIFLKMIIPRSL
ncbi:MAG: hypothetical protein B1H11_11445 [Desulfobacteraceae bacterium 4484_190.1]|nr:MAG: hypothetical protein B1H11_11445 [Desulfobacteraceae bacterium 4484_190.1]